MSFINVVNDVVNVVVAGLCVYSSGLLQSALVNVTLADIERIRKTGVFSALVSVKLLNPFDCDVHIKSLDLFVSAGYSDATAAVRSLLCRRSRMTGSQLQVLSVTASPVRSCLLTR
jgi:hypothetical protein